MTRTPRSHASLLRRLVVGAAAAVATLTVTLAAPASASATTQSTSSPTVASSANHALWLLVHWQDTQTVADYTAYLEARSKTARATAAEVGASPDLLEAAWALTSIENQHVVLSAMSQLGVPYRNRMSKEYKGFDCSGLVYYAYSQAGIELPRSSGQIIRSAEQIEALDADAGDLVYYPGHISIYIGAGLVVHSPQSGKTVEVRSLFTRSLRYGDAIPDLPGAP